MQALKNLLPTPLSVVMLATLVCLAGCGRIRTDPPSQNLSVIELPQSTNGCACPGAQRYQITNMGPGTWSPKAMIYSKEPLDTVPKVVSQQLSLPQGGTQKLECSIQPTEVSKQCMRNVITVIGNKSYGGDINEGMKDIVAVTAKADLQNMDRQESPTRNCAALCKNDNSASCTQFNATSSGSVDVGRSIALLLGKPSPTITKEDVIHLTGDTSMPDNAKTNVCLRSDFVFELSQAYNVGMADNCQIRAESALLGTLDIDIPRTVSFRHTTGGGGNFDALFQYKQAAPKLKFSNETYEYYLGGYVLAAGYDAGKFWLESERHSCFAVKVN